MTATSEFDYDLPEEAIAQKAIEPRHAARLLDTRGLSDHRFADLPSLLRPGDLVVLNRTRVRRSRLMGRKAGTGGSVELLLLRPIGDGGWEVLLKPARRLRAGSTIELSEAVVSLRGDPVEGRAVIEVDSGSLDAAIDGGEVPLPPYFHGELDDPERYQTVYGDTVGSAAAPTAGLHFTSKVLAGLENAGIALGRVDLEVGLDTFRPIQTATVESHRMHAERVTVEADVIEEIASTRSAGGRVVAVGTTVVRALESASRSGEPAPFSGPTDLFISPGFRFRSVDLLVTNFHAPRSTLIVLLAAFMGDGWRHTYTTALERGYRFLSFGDSMLAERAG